jgi:hypothetical protein
MILGESGIGLQSTRERLAGVLTSIQATATTALQRALWRRSLLDKSAATHDPRPSHSMPRSSLDRACSIATPNCSKRSLSVGNPRFEENQDEENEEQVSAVLIQQNDSQRTSDTCARWALAISLAADDPAAVLDALERCSQAGPLELINEYNECQQGQDDAEISVNGAADGPTRAQEIDQALRDALIESRQVMGFESYEGRPPPALVMACETLAFVVAAAFGCARVVKKLLLLHGSLCREEGHTALLQACVGGHESVVELMLADADFARSSREHIAVAARMTNIAHEGVIKLLLRHLQLHDPSGAWHLRFELCCRGGRLTEVEAMLAQAQATEGGQEDLKACANRAICAASEAGHLQVVERLLQDARFDPSMYECRALWRASSNGHVAIVRMMLQDDRINSGTGDSLYLAFEHSCNVGDTETVEALLREHPDLDITAESQSVFNMVAQTAHTEVLALLLNDPRINPALFESIALHHACRSEEQLPTVKMLLQVSDECEREFFFFFVCV